MKNKYQRDEMRKSTKKRKKIQRGKEDKNEEILQKQKNKVEKKL